MRLFFLLLLTNFHCIASLATVPDDTLMQERWHIRKIRFIGNVITKEHIIMREMTFQEGDNLLKTGLTEVLDFNKRRILNLQLFTTVEVHHVELPADSIDIIFTVNELFYWIPNPILSLADRNFNVWYKEQHLRMDRTNIGMQLTRLNFRGRSERIGGTVQVGYNKYFDLFYKIPFIDRKLKHGLGISMTYATGREINYRTNKNKLEFYRNDHYPYRKFQTELTYTYRPAYALIHEFNLSYNYYLISNELFQKNQQYLGNKRKINYAELKYVVRFNNTDIRIYPLNGIEAQISFSKKGLGIDKDINQFALKTEVAFFKKINHLFSTSFVVRGRLSYPHRQPYFLNQALGYKSEYVRGYEYYVIDGSDYGLLRTNIRYKIMDRIWHQRLVKAVQYIPLRIYAKAYDDIGYVYNHAPESSFLNNRLLNGFGMGIDIIISYYFKFRIEYSFNHLNQKGLFLHGNKE